MKDPAAPRRSQARDGTLLRDGRSSTSPAGPRRALLVLLGVLSAFGPLSMDLYLPSLPSLEAEFGAGQSAVQLTMTTAAIGLAVGQLLAGPLSDRFGRRGPVLVGVAAYAVASLLCAVSPDVWVLCGIRLLQGMAGAAGIVLARAVVRDLMEGREAARMFAVLASIMGAAPVLAPVAGGQLLRITDWRGVFVALTVIGVVILVASLRVLPETLPAERRITGGLRTTLHNGRTLLTRRIFLAAVLSMGLGFGAMFTYISTSSFVLQTGYGLTAQQFSFDFGINGLGIVGAGQLSRVLVRRVGPRALLVAGLTTQLLGGVVMIATALLGWGLPVLLPALFVMVTANGLILPNATALAMADAAEMAGTASALVGVAQFAIGGLAAPLAGLGTPGTLLPMALVIVSFAAAGWVVAVVFGRSPRPAASPPAARAMTDTD